MAAGVHQDRMLIEPLQGMVDQTDVGTEKEDPGRTMSTGFQVSFSRNICLKSGACLKVWLVSIVEVQQENFTLRLLNAGHLENS